MPPKIPGVWGLAPKEHESHYFTLHEGIQNDFLNQLLTRIKTVAHPVPLPKQAWGEGDTFLAGRLTFAELCASWCELRSSEFLRIPLQGCWNFCTFPYSLSTANGSAKLACNSP
jgi:hypothetical protein